MMLRRGFHSSLCIQATNRIPLIKFLGKRSNIKVNTIKQIPVNNSSRSTASSSTSTTTTTSKTQPTPMSIKGTSTPGSGIDFRTLKGGAMYGRPAMSIKEMEEIDSGGASAF